MEKNGYHHSVGSPSMEVSQYFAIKYKSEGLHIEVGPFQRRGVKKHQQDAGDGENEKEETGDPSETERIRDPEAMAFHPCRKDVEKEVVKHYHGSL
jgi:hypothetical protein